MSQKINSQKSKTILVLHNIRSTHNAGSLFRTADGAGINEIVLSGYTPEPIDRFGRARNDIAKTALGAEKNIPWQKIKDLTEYLKEKKQEKFLISAIEQDKKSIFYKKAKKAKKQILILGNEVEGIEKDVLKMCDQIIEIPMRGEKESLNVSIAGAIVMFEILA